MTIIEETYDWLTPPIKRDKTTYLILHHVGAAGNFSAQQIHAQHLANGWKGIAYNYYVRRDGSIYRGRPEDAIGGHTSGYNTVSIGVCFEGNFEAEQMGEAQHKAGLELVASIQRRYPGIKTIGHREVNATACPGKNFPLADFRRAEELIETNTFKDIEGHWARLHIERCAEAGLVTGRTKDTFAPNEPITRAEVCTILSRLLDRLEGEK